MALEKSKVIIPICAESILGYSYITKLCFRSSSEWGDPKELQKVQRRPLRRARIFVKDSICVLTSLEHCGQWKEEAMHCGSRRRATYPRGEDL